MRRNAEADATNSLLVMEQAGRAAGDKRFLAQLAGVKALVEKGDWRGVTIGCRMLYRIAQEGNFLDKIEGALRPFFEAAVAKFEQSRAAMRKLHARLLSASLKLKQVDRLAHLLKVSA
jgi:hypothetical protein